MHVLNVEWFCIHIRICFSATNAIRMPDRGRPAGAAQHRASTAAICVVALMRFMAYVHVYNREHVVLFFIINVQLLSVTGRK